MIRLTWLTKIMAITFALVALVVTTTLVLQVSRTHAVAHGSSAPAQVLGIAVDPNPTNGSSGHSTATTLPTQVLGVAIERNPNANGSRIASGQAAANTKAQSFQVAGQVTALYPGAQTQLVLTIGNSNNFAINVTSITAAVGVPTNAGCPASAITVTGFNGSLIIAKNGSAQQAITISMSNSVPDACQGATFPLTYGGSAVKA